MQSAAQSAEAAARAAAAAFAQLGGGGVGRLALDLSGAR